jgi:rhombotail lipoprotein
MNHRILLLVASVALVSGCQLFGAQQHHASSVVDYLYSGETGNVEKPSIPTLRLPLKAGVAFVPPASYGNEVVISEKQQLELMAAVRTGFENLAFVESIEVIPTAYLRPRGGFTNLDQLRTMFGIDVMVLLSYDIVQFTGEGFSSISYWTLVGAYVVRGEQNDTHTMIDAAVYDIASRKLLFRAPGVSQVQGKATPVGQADQLRRDREEGFALAAADLVPNLQARLDVFKQEVETEKVKAKVVYSGGYTGGGRTDLATLILLLALGAGITWARLSERTTR